MEYVVSTPGGAKVEVAFGKHKLETDQPLQEGGEGSAPTPYQIFLASIAACSGFYALIFCQQRNLPTEGLKIVMDAKTPTEMKIKIRAPDGFPEKYQGALIASVKSCAIKKAIDKGIRIDAALSD
jgi:putative redox protein